MPGTRAICNEILNALWNGASVSSYPATYLAMLSADPTVSGSWASEFAATLNYGRATVNGKMGTATLSTLTNTATISWNTASGVWGTFAYWALSNTSTPGTGAMIQYGAMSTPTQVATGGVHRSLPGQLVISLS